MNSKYSNKDLINATLEIYNNFEPSSNGITKNTIKKNTIKKNNIKIEPLLLSKEIKIKKKTKTQHFLNYKSPTNQKINNKQRLSAYQKKRVKYNLNTMLRLNKIIKFENEKYLLLHKIKNSDLKIIKMKRPGT
tara:strand:- start:1920 stop:2318 length:399 start_codon:yes stop_codon:yes gene_type:complete